MVRSSGERSDSPRRAHMRRARGVAAAMARWRMSSAESVVCGRCAGTRPRPLFAAVRAPARSGRAVFPLFGALSVGPVGALRTKTEGSRRLYARPLTRRHRAATRGEAAVPLAGRGRGGQKASMPRVPAPPLRVSPLTAFLLIGSAAALGACGHPASEQECNTIIEKSAELELRAQNVTDPA